MQVVRARFTCPLRNGVHARPAGVLADAARPFASSITVTRCGADQAAADIRSVLSLVSLDIAMGDEFEIVANGPDAQAAIDALRVFIESSWAESDEHPPLAPDAGCGVNAELPIGLRGKDITHVLGTPVCAGVGVGVAVIAAGLTLPDDLLNAKPVSASAEAAAADVAMSAVIADLRQRAARAPGKFEGDLLAAHAEIAGDPALKAHIHARIAAGDTAPQAVVAAAHWFSDRLRTAASAYIRDRAADVHDVCLQVLDRVPGVSGGGEGSLAERTTIRLTEPSIVLGDMLTANQLLRMDHTLLRGLVLGSIGATSHTIILARSLQIPTIRDARQALTLFRPGEKLILDAEAGIAIRADEPAVVRYYEIHQRTLERRAARMAPLALRPGMTHDGVRLEVAANASTPAETAAAMKRGAEGVGLLRTELLFLERPDAPGEDEQYAAYAGVVKAASGSPVIIRTFDIGGDKPAAYMSMPREDNPFLGCRGLRLYPRYEKLLRTQLRAIARASAHGPVKVMAPMVAIPAEAAYFREQVAAAQSELAAAGIAFDPKMPVGVMIEVPSLALAVADLARHIDFCSIGTNDLTQYWLATDRGNSSIAALYNPRHPSFLRLLNLIVSEARKAGTWIGVCGEMAGDRRHLPLLVGMGVNEISVAPGEIGAIKVALAELDSTKAKETLAAALACQSPLEVDECLRNAASPSPGNQRVLDQAAIVVGSGATSKEEAIKEAVDAVFVAGRTDRPRVMEAAVWAREQTSSTGLGYGFAVPHCKTDALASPTVGVVTLRSAVDWGSIDDQPVDMIILLGVPASDTTGMHMKIFAKLARRLMHEEFRDRLRAAADPAAIESFLKQELELA